MPTYANGLVPRSAMKQFRNTGKYGHPVFIDHLDAAFTAVQRELGITLFIASGQDIFRDIAGQKYWKTYWTNQGHPGNAAGIGLSNHGLARSADISGLPAKGSAMWNKVVAIFRRFHIEFDVPYESWHVTDTSISVVGNRVTINVPAVPAYSGNPAFPAVALFKIVQTNYNFIGYHLTVDGLDGPQVDAAVRDFQRKHGLVVDGHHGKATNQALDDAVNAKHRADAAKAAAKPKPKPATPAKPKPIAEVVKDQQRRLNVWRAATPPLKVDGIPGPRFKQATIVFQKARHITADGVIGPKTWALLLKNP